MALCSGMGCNQETDGVKVNKVVDESSQSPGGSFGRNGIVSASGSDMDEKVLIDPRKLFIGAKIGEGAHGKVYEGKYCEQIIAVKVLNCGDTPEEREKCKGRFIREVNMMSRVNHHNLVKFIGACMDPFMVIATELLPGMSLKSFLSSLRPKKLDIHVVVNYALDIARAMDWLHANGIIHRDLKPDNLLLTENQKNVKLADFGLAREETLTEMMTAETGTYRWMAPELYSTVTLRRGDKKHYTNKVDVYSFGFVLWELLTNRMPFEGMSNLQAAYAAAFKQVRPPLPEDAPPELVFIVQSCWVEDPSIRPSFNQIVRMLSAFFYTLPPPPRDASAAPAPAEVSSRNAEVNLAGTTTSPRGTVTRNLRKQTGNKPSFLRQLFNLKIINSRRP